ncbi:alpha/beta fold hydrolase [Burkholderia stagnalis]
MLPQGAGWKRGIDADFLARLLSYWQYRYDWRTHEAHILGLPWEAVGSGDRALRVVHQRASASKSPAVVLLHGWPDSILRFQRLLPLLADVHVVIPALPGFPFSYELTQPGMTVATMALLVADAMQTLGYDRYVVSAGDLGADVAEHLAAAHSDRISALHLTNISPLHAVFANRSALDAQDCNYLDTVAIWQRREGGYIAQQSTKPDTLAAGLADSPAGLAAWLVEKLWSWSDIPFSEDDLLTWVSAYWFTGTIGTSFTPYVEFVPPVRYVSTPTVLSAFAHDTKPAPRGFASRFVNVQEFIEHERGGHFAAWEQPECYADDLRRAISLGYASVA